MSQLYPPGASKTNRTARSGTDTSAKTLFDSADLRLNLTVFRVTRQRYCTSSLYTGSGDSIANVFFAHTAFPLVAAKRKFSSHSSTSSSSADGKMVAATSAS